VEAVVPGGPRSLEEFWSANHPVLQSLKTQGEFRGWVLGTEFATGWSPWLEPRRTPTTRNKEPRPDRRSVGCPKFVYKFRTTPRGSTGYRAASSVGSDADPDRSLSARNQATFQSCRTSACLGLSCRAQRDSRTPSVPSRRRSAECRRHLAHRPQRGWPLPGSKQKA
jgi:hypothetical protein